MLSLHHSRDGESGSNSAKSNGHNYHFIVQYCHNTTWYIISCGFCWWSVHYWIIIWILRVLCIYDVYWNSVAEDWVGLLFIMDCCLCYCCFISSWCWKNRWSLPYIFNFCILCHDCIWVWCVHQIWCSAFRWQFTTTSQGWQVFLLPVTHILYRPCVQSIKPVTG